jgi:PAS domain S-box-containing protein
MRDGKVRMKLMPGLIVLGFYVAALFWVVESLLYAFAFDRGSLLEAMLPSDAHELWIRSLVVSALIGFGIHAQAIVNQRNTAKEDSQSKEEYFRALTENATDAIIVLNGDGTIRYESPSVQRVLGRDPADRAGNNPFDFVHPDDLPRVTQLYTRLMDTPSDIVQTELRSQHGDGSWRTIGIVGKNLLDDPVVSGIVVTTRDITERREAEEKLQHSEEYFRALTENSLDGVIKINADATTRYISPSFERMLGHQPAERHGRNILELVHEDDAPLIASAFSGLLERQADTIQLEVRVRHKDGSWRVLEATGNSMLDNPAVAGIVGNFRDITERKQAEEKLQYSERYFRSLIENASDAIQIVTQDGRISYQSPSFERVLGYNAEEATAGGGVFEHIHPDDLAGAADTLGRIVQEPGGTVRTEIRAQHKDGSWRTISAVATNLLADPAVNGIVANLSDVTEQRRAEESLRDSAKHYSTLVGSLSEAVFWFVDGNVVWCNDRAEEMYGHDKQELIGKEASFFLSPDVDTTKFARAAFKEIRQHGAHLGRSKFHKKDGTIIDIEYSISRIPEKDPVELVAVARDITDQARAEEEIRSLNEDLEERVVERTTQLQAVNTELEAFAYSVSHDLRAPLRSIDGFSQVLAEDYGDRLDEEGRDYLKRVRSASQRMGELIDDMLTLSRLTRGEMKREAVDLTALAQGIAEELRQTDPERKVDFTIAPDLAVTGDSHLMRVALQNLLSNAWKFTGTHEQATIEFGCTDSDGQPAYFVRDDGVGFDMAYADKLFGAFQRLHGPGEFEGTGVGLATVQRIVHRHAGNIWAESAVEQGTTFYFTL